MKQITLDEFFKILEEIKNTSLAAIVNAYELDTVYCIDQFDHQFIEERTGRILRLISKNGERDYYDYHGIYISLKDIAKISITVDTIYVYLQNQIVKLKVSKEILSKYNQ